MYCSFRFQGHQSYIMETKLEWETISTWETGMGLEHLCSGLQIAMLVSPWPIRRNYIYLLLLILNISMNL